jgi:hypothetical protein
MITWRSILSNDLTDYFSAFDLPINEKGKENDRAKYIISDYDHLIYFYIFCSF